MWFVILGTRCPEGGEYSWDGVLIFVIITIIIIIRQQRHCTVWGAEPHKCDPNINCLDVSNSPRLLRSPCRASVLTGKPLSSTTFLISQMCKDSWDYYFLSFLVSTLSLTLCYCFPFLHVTWPHSGH